MESDETLRDQHTNADALDHTNKYRAQGGEDHDNEVTFEANLPDFNEL